MLDRRYRKIHAHYQMSNCKGAINEYCLFEECISWADSTNSLPMICVFYVKGSFHLERHAHLKMSYPYSVVKEEETKTMF